MTIVTRKDSPLDAKPIETMSDTELLRVFLDEVFRARRVLGTAVVEKQLLHRTAAESAYEILDGICDQIPRYVGARQVKPKRQKGT